MNASRPARISTPAKINLGLEILGRGDDGYHELRSVLAMIDLVDDLTFSVNAASGETTINGFDSVAASDNLIMLAIHAFGERSRTTLAYSVSVTKRIPAPSGLGGASSNAAATLLALNAMHDEPLSADALQEIAAGIGSDVPFFLGNPTAMASGRGTHLTPLPNVEGWVLLAAPRIALTSKTTHLYGMLTPEDFSDGTTVQRVVEQIRRHKSVPPDALTNTFERPLRLIAPGVIELKQQMHEAGCRHVALSGAGPAHYALFNDRSSAGIVASRLRDALQNDVTVAVVPFRTSPLTVDVDVR